DDLDSFSHRSRYLLSGLLVDLARPIRYRRRSETPSAFYGKINGSAPKVREISIREQALSRRRHALRPGGDYHGRVHDVSSAHRLFPAQSLSLQRYDMGHDVCVARAGRSWAHHADHRSRVLRHQAGEVADHGVDDCGLHEPRVLFKRA